MLTFSKCITACLFVFALTDKQVSAEPFGDWSGAYVGIGASAIRGNTGFEIPSLSQTLSSVEMSSTRGSVQIGYNWQRRRFVFGPFAEASLGKLTGSVDPSSCATCQIKLSEQVSVGARLGYSLDATLIYTKLGAVRGTALVTENSGVLYTDYGGPGTVSGWSFGLGAEHKISPNVSVYGEIIHTDLGEFGASTFIALGPRLNIGGLDAKMPSRLQMPSKSAIACAWFNKSGAGA